MAITYLTGIPRSGKSYWAVYKLYHLFVEKKRKRSFLIDFFYKKFYRRVKKENRRSFIQTLYNLFGKKEKIFYYAYTNINQFDFSKSSRIKPFDYDVLFSHLEYLHAMFLSKSTDAELLDYARLHGLYKVIFVIDECQNYFAKDNAVLTWWFSYHGHLHQDIFLITQNLGLVFKEYFKVSEFFYRAIPPSNRLYSNKFRYMQFNSYQLYKTDRIGVFNVPIIQDVFKMYVSGAENNSPSVVRKYFFFSILFFLFLIIAFSFFLSSFSTGTPKPVISSENNQSSISSVTQQDKKPSSKDKANTKKDDEKKEIKDELFDIKCIDMLCSYKGIDFPRPLLNKLTAKLEPDFIWFFNDGSYIQYFVMLPSDTFDFLQKIEKDKFKKGANDEKSKDAKSSNHFPVATAITSHK